MDLKGIGFIYIRRTIPLPSFMLVANKRMERRAERKNIPAIAGSKSGRNAQLKKKNTRKKD